MPNRSAASPRRMLYIIAGWILVGLATAGLALPLLPATPFLLLAAWCFARSSPRFHAWLTGHRVFGQIIAAYKERKGLTVQQKAATLASLWLAMGVSGFLVPILWVRLVFAAIGLGVSIHILRMKTRAGACAGVPSSSGIGEAD